MNLGVSIVVVTYNGKSRLKETITHLANQKHIDFPLELLVVDNNSSDDSSNFVRQLWDSLNSPFPLRIIHESRPGTMYARKRGIDEASYRYLLYCDDDNWLQPNYVFEAFTSILDKPEIAAIGGRGIFTPENLQSTPAWLVPFERNFGCTPQGNNSGDITNDKGCLYSAGCILDRVWMDKLYTVGFSSVLQGRDGKSLIAGEDTELTFALKLIGGKLYYNEQMYFWHLIPDKRMTWSYLRKLHFGFGKADMVLLPYNRSFSNNILRDRLVLLLTKLKEIIKFFLKKILSTKSINRTQELKLRNALGGLHTLIFNWKKMKHNIDFKDGIIKKQIGL